MTVIVSGYEALANSLLNIICTICMPTSEN